MSAAFGRREAFLAQFLEAVTGVVISASLAAAVGLMVSIGRDIRRLEKSFRDSV